MSSQLTNIATLFKQLKATLDLGGTHDNARQDTEREKSTESREGGEESDTDSSTLPSLAPPPDLVVLAPPGTKPLCNRMLSRNNRGMSVVYSRSSNQVLLSGKTPDPSLVVLKDSTPRSIEVSVPRPSEVTGGFRWTRAGIRAIKSANRLTYLEESEMSSGEFSSSDSDAGVFKPIVERKKKKRVRRKPPQGSKGSRDERVSEIAELVSSGEEESMEGDHWEGSVQMECEVGGEDFETQSPMLILQSTSDNVPVVTASASIPRVSPAKVFTVYEDLKLIQPNMEHLSDSIGDKTGTGAEGSAKQEKQLRPCTVRVTSLPHHVIDKHRLPMKIKKSTAVEATAADLCRDSMCSDESSTSSSESVSLLRPQSHNLSSQGGSKKVQYGSGQPSPPLTPQRLGDRSKEPVARRSIPFSKAPRTLTGKSSNTTLPASPFPPTTSHTTSSEHSLVPTTDKPSHTTSSVHSLIPTTDKPTSSEHSLVPTTIKPSPATSSEHSLVPTTTAKPTSVVIATAPHPTLSKSSLLPAKSPLQSLHPKSSSTRFSSSSSASSCSTTPPSTKPPLGVPAKDSAGAKAMVVGWSSDEDFEATPGPSIISPTIIPPSVGRKPSTKKEKNDEVAGSLPTNLKSAVSSRGCASSGLRQSSEALVKLDRGGEGRGIRATPVVAHKKMSPSKDLPVKTEAHSASEDKSVLDDGMTCEELVEVFISCVCFLDRSCGSASHY